MKRTTQNQIFTIPSTNKQFSVVCFVDITFLEHIEYTDKQKHTLKAAKINGFDKQIMDSKIRKCRIRVLKKCQHNIVLENILLSVDENHLCFFLPS